MSDVDKKIQKRAAKAIKNLPFNSYFYETVKKIGLNARFVFKNKSTYLKKDFVSIKNSESIESDFLWLIKIGVLRREVDGQGLTSKVRITPLGKEIFEENPKSLEIKTNLLKRIIVYLRDKLIDK